ncbi:MAG: SDR family oxidoreductase [Pseudomonadota bacterium]
MSQGLEGAVVLVTGAGGTIGRAVLAALGQAGAIAVGADRAPGPGIDHVFDVTDEAGWAAAASVIDGAHGRLDGLVTAAGIMHVAGLTETAYTDFQLVMAVNVDGTFLAAKTCWPLLQRGAAPSIVTLSSVSGLIGGAKFIAYNASKGAVRIMTKSLALAGAREAPPIRANSVHPAFVEGEMVDGIAALMRDPATGHDKMRAMVPMGRFAEPQEIAAAILGLLSPASAFTTGAEIVIDGGLTAQ